MSDESLQPNTAPVKTWRTMFDVPFNKEYLAQGPAVDQHTTFEPAYPDGKPNPLAYEGLPPGHIAIKSVEVDFVAES